MLNFTHISHLFKLVWNRKRSNALMVVELFAAFLVLFLVSTAIIHYLANSRKPLGYSYANVWNVLAIPKEAVLQSAEMRSSNAERVRSAQNIVAMLRLQPEVALVSFASTTPFSTSTWMRRFREGDGYEVETIEVTDDMDKTLDMRVSEGRWFNASDEMYNGTSATVKPVVINELTAQAYFGAENPIGKFLRESGPDSEGRPQTGLRVIGVVKDFRKRGEYSRSQNVLFQRVSLQDTSAQVPSQLLIAMRPGVEAMYEEKLLTLLQQTAPDWSFQISTLEQDHVNIMKMYLIPLGVGMIIAAFLLITIGLGLVGVVWQSVMRRMRELGVRRAFGATRSDVTSFVLGEIIVLTTFSVVLGLVVLGQLPLTPIFDFISRADYGMGLAVSVVGMYAGVTLCALYPSRIAARIQPSEALRYE